MPNIAHLTDLHVYPTSEFSRMSSDFSSPDLEFIHKTVDWFLETLRDKHLHAIVIGGDTFDTNGKIDTASKLHASRIIKKIASFCEDKGMELIILTGNHEVYDKSAQVSVIEYFEYFSDCVTVVKKPAVMYIDKVPFGFIPYNYEGEEAVEGITQLSKVLFTHVDISEYEISPKHKSHSGFKLSKLQHGSTMINGHYHEPNITHISHGSVLYHTGAPYNRNFNDGTTARGFRIYDFDDTGGCVKSTHYENPNYVGYYVIDLTKQSQEDYDRILRKMNPELLRTRLLCLEKTVDIVDWYDSYKFLSHRIMQLPWRKQEVIDEERELLVVPTVEEIAIEVLNESGVPDTAYERIKSRTLDIIRKVN